MFFFIIILDKFDRYMMLSEIFRQQLAENVRNQTFAIAISVTKTVFPF